MSAAGRAPVVRPEHRRLYDDACLVLDRHQPVVRLLHAERCSYCGEPWECAARVLAVRACQIAMTPAAYQVGAEP